MTSRSSVDQLPIAIVGIGCRFPGGITDADSFWRVVRDGVDAITEIPSNRMDVDRFYDPEPATPGRIMSRFGGYLDDIDRFDAEFFGISPREAERVDPQQRLLLETAWESLEDAGVDIARLSGTTTGVFVGQWLSDFEGRLFAEPERVDFYMTTGSGRYAASGRISYALGLRGPSLTLDTGCSSSLAAVHLAVRSLRSGESELALAGGVNVILQPHITVAYSQSRMMAADGRCKFGDAAGDGYVRSEGAGLLALKPLDRAIADGDRVYAVIRGSAVNNDGNSSGSMGTPSRVGQVELLRSAYRDAGVSAGRLGYIEAHGTGTRAGDPVELGALGEVVSDGRQVGHPVWIGSVKTNLGHTEGAAGVAGLIKAALAVHHGTIPASLHFKIPNPTVPWQTLPLQIPREPVSWSDDAGLRLAGVNSFGIGGTNAHVVLEQAPKSPTVMPVGEESEDDLSLLTLSARSPEALRATAARYADRLDHGDVSLRNVCWSAATRRTRLDHRAAFVAANRPLMADALRRYAAGETAAAESVLYGDTPPKIAFIFPGQGGQWAGMARELVNREPVFRDAIARCDAAARPFLDESITDRLMNDPETSAVQLQRIDIVQPLLVAIAIAYAELWRSKGVEPDAVVGHSMGEVAAAYVAGALTLEQAMRIICRRSALMRRTSGQGAMALVDLSMAEARQRLAGLEDRVVVAVGNSPRSSVISGDPVAVGDVIARLEREQVFCRPVKVDVASHSPQMDPVKSALRDELDGLRPTAARLPIYSTVAGRRLEGDAFDASYWADNVRQPVLFGDTIAQMLTDGITVFVELGPHPVLLPSIQQTAQSLTKDITAVGCGHRDDGDCVAFARAIGVVACSGRSVDWSRIMPGGGRNVQLPSYPWQRQRHWNEAAELSTGAVATRSTARLDPSMQPWLYQLQWKSADRPAVSSPTSTAPTLVVGAADASTLSSAFVAIGGRAAAVSRSDLDTALRRESYDAIVCVIEDDDGPYAPVMVMQSLLAASPERPARVWFVTRGAQVVDGLDGQASVTQAALWGAARVVAEEHPECWGGLIDLDAERPFHEAVARVAAEVGASDADDQIAFRGDRRFVLRLTALDPQLPVEQAFQWRADAAYLVTGGLGDVGMHLARAMVAHGARRLILLNRTALPPREDWSRLSESDPASRRVAAIRELEAQGVAVHFAAVDVSDERQLTAFLAQYATEAWPPIRGVVHAAGALNNKLVRDMDAATFDSVVRAKVDGAQLLDRLLPELDLFVMCSSTGAFLAQPGQANYAAANTGLDAVAQNRSLRGARALSIEWGIWQDTGLVRGEAGERNVSELARQGVGTFTPEQGSSLFAWLTRTAARSAAVLPVDWPVFAAARSGRRAGFFADVLASVSAGGRSTSILAQALAEAQPAKRRQILESTVRDAVTQVLKISPSRLDPRKALGEMGLNSLMAMELRNRLEAALGRSLSATLAWNYPTVDAIVQHLAAPVEPPPTAASSQDAESGVSASLGNVNELSDDDAALALRSRV